MRNYMSTDRVPKENKVNNKLTKALNKLAKQLSDKENATVIQFRYLGDRWSVLASPVANDPEKNRRVGEFFHIKTVKNLEDLIK